MKKTKDAPAVQFIMSLPEEVKYDLIRMAAKNNLANPGINETPSKIARRILCDHMEKVNQKA